MCEVDADGIVTGTYGYAYDAVVGSFAVAPDIDDVEEPVKAYREWLRQEGDEGVNKMIFHFDRETSKFNANANSRIMRVGCDARKYR